MDSYQKITKTFISGVLEGITFEEIMLISKDRPYVVGQVVEGFTKNMSVYRVDFAGTPSAPFTKSEWCPIKKARLPIWTPAEVAAGGELVEIRRDGSGRNTLVFAWNGYEGRELREVVEDSLPLPLEAYTAFQTVPVIEVE